MQFSCANSHIDGGISLYRYWSSVTFLLLTSVILRVFMLSSISGVIIAMVFDFD